MRPIILNKEGESKKIDYTKLKDAIFAGGCFWCNEAAFEALDGVIEAVTGYTGGNTENPTYEEVSSGTTGHHEAVKVIYDPLIISYKALIERFWRQIDPTDDEGQFIDKGSQYKTAIYYSNKGERKIAESSKKKLEKSGRFKKPIATKILERKPFYEAEEYHQDYYKKKVWGYNIYKKSSGRDKLKEIWK